MKKVDALKFADSFAALLRAILAAEMTTGTHAAIDDCIKEDREQLQAFINGSTAFLMTDDLRLFARQQLDAYDIGRNQ